MNPGQCQHIEAERQALLNQLQTAEATLRAGLHHAHDLDSTARAHIERARSHIAEAYIAINEAKAVRNVAQLVDDLVRVEQVMTDVKRRQSQRI